MRILFGKGDGTFANPASIVSLALQPLQLFMKAADFNGDGILDLAIAQYNGAVQILLGFGDGTFSTDAPLVTTLPYSSKLIECDLNGDSIPDLVIPSSSGATYLLGNRDGTFQPPVVFATTGLLALADLDGDGAMDVAIATQAGIAGLLNRARIPAK